MGLFDALFGRRAPEVGDPEQLRALLFEAARAGDLRRVEALCRKNRSLVAESFPVWQKLPESIRNDPAAAGEYVGGMVAVARVFAERLGDATLLNLLTGTAESNPLMRWEGVM